MPGSLLIRESADREYGVTVTGLYELDGQRALQEPVGCGADDHRRALVGSDVLRSDKKSAMNVVAAKRCAAFCRVSTDERLHQSFNSTTSMGRLMLNVLLSFAQFEREVTGERIRDKIAASKAKGMWMGGQVPLGYEVQNRRLVANEVEATLVRRIFADFVRCRSTTDLVRELATDGKTTKSRRPLTKQMLYKMMHSRIYLGEILHKGKDYSGQHQAMISRDLWDAVHAILAENNRQRAAETRMRRNPSSPLLGILFTQDGEGFQPAFTRKANGTVYRYYVPIRKVRFGSTATRAGRLPVEAIEQLVLAQVHSGLQTPEAVQAVCNRVAATAPKVTEPDVVLALRQLGNVWEQLFPAERQRIVQLLIERVTLLDHGIEITGREAGWSALVGELLPETIGAELREVAEAEEALV